MGQTSLEDAVIILKLTKRKTVQVFHNLSGSEYSYTQFLLMGDLLPILVYFLLLTSTVVVLVVKVCVCMRMYS